MSNRPSPDPSFILRGANSTVTSLAFQSNDSLFSGNQDGKVHHWSLANRRIKATLNAHDDHTVLWVCPWSEGHLLTQGREGTVRTWNCQDSAWQNTGQIHCASLGFCAGAWVKVNNTNLVAVPSDITSQVDIFNMENQSKILSLKPDSSQKKTGMTMSITSLNEQSESNSQLLVGYENGSIMLWDLRNRKTRSVLEAAHEESVMCMDFCAPLMKGFSGSVDTKLISWTVDSENSITKLSETEITNPGLNEIVVRQDGKLVATAGWDSNIRLFGCKKTKPLAVLSYHKQSVQSIAFSPDNLLACGSKDNLISLWDVYR